MTQDPESSLKNVPRCVGFILDGNRRCAEKRGFHRHAGHGWGYTKTKEAVEWVKEHNIPHVVVYGLSTENLKRSKEELDNIFNLARFAFSKDEVRYFMRRGVRLSFIGDFKRLPSDLEERIYEVEKETAQERDVHLVIALSYGGRAEILDAVKRLAWLRTPDEIKSMTEEEFEDFLWTGRASPLHRDVKIPDPDLIIRTGGEMRLSNFLLWQASYSELFFTPTLWPDFTKEEFEKILKEFSARKRNSGK